MKKLIALLLLLPVVGLAQTPQNIQKLSGNLTQSFNVDSGKNITASGTGTIQATSVEGLSVTAGKTLTASNTLTLTGTDGSSVDFGTGGTVLYSGGSYVSSLTGTANQITASASTGAVGLSLDGPHNFTTLTSTALLLGAGTSPISASDITYSTPTLTVPASFAITGAGALTFNAGGSNQNITINPSGSGDLVINTDPAGDTLFQFDGTNFRAKTYSSSAASSRSQFRTERFRGSLASPAAVQNADMLGTFAFLGYDGTTSQQPAQISATVDGAVSSGAVPTGLFFATGSSAGTRANRLSIGSNGSVSINTVGQTLDIKQGTNGKAGTFTLVAGAATVSNTSITANSVVIVTLKTVGGTRVGNPDIVPTASTGFTATGAGTDTSTYNYIVLEATP